MIKLRCLLVLALVLGFAVLAVAAVTPDNPVFSVKAGDEVYVCGCGKACPCSSMSKVPAPCGCGKDMVKASVVKVDGDTAVMNVNGQEQNFKLKGKYVCGCGAACPCDYVSQNPGKCGCGKDLVPAKAQ